MRELQERFQFLIGSLEASNLYNKEEAKFFEFQFLIGSLEALSTLKITIIVCSFNSS